MSKVWFGRQNLITAVEFGQVRARASVHRRDNWGLVVSDDEASQIEDARRQTIGTLGEWAVANYFGQKYEFTVDTFKEPDVWVPSDARMWGIQVKASEYGKNFIIRPDAKDWEPYVYCYVELPKALDDPRQYVYNLGDREEDRANVWIKGWMFPAEARERARDNPRLVRDPGGRKAPAIFIPVPEIRPIRELKDIINA